MLRSWLNVIWKKLLDIVFLINFYFIITRIMNWIIISCHIARCESSQYLPIRTKHFELCTYNKIIKTKIFQKCYYFVLILFLQRIRVLWLLRDMEWHKLNSSFQELEMQFTIIFFASGYLMSMSNANIQTYNIEFVKKSICVIPNI